MQEDSISEALKQIGRDQVKRSQIPPLAMKVKNKNLKPIPDENEKNHVWQD